MQSQGQQYNINSINISNTNMIIISKNIACVNINVANPIQVQNENPEPRSANNTMQVEAVLGSPHGISWGRLCHRWGRLSPLRKFKANNKYAVGLRINVFHMFQHIFLHVHLSEYIVLFSVPRANSFQPGSSRIASVLVSLWGFGDAHFSPFCCVLVSACPQLPPFATFVSEFGAGKIKRAANGER